VTQPLAAVQLHAAQMAAVQAAAPAEGYGSGAPGTAGLPPPTAPTRKRPDERAGWESSHLDEDGLPAMLGDGLGDDLPPDSGASDSTRPPPRRKRSPQANRLVGILLGVAALILIAGGVRAVMASRERQAEEERERAAEAASAAAARANPAPTTSALTAAIATAPAATAAPSAAAAGSAAVDPSVAAGAPAATSEPGGLPAGGAPAPVITQGGGGGKGGPEVTIPSVPAGPSKPARETALDVPPAAAGSSLVAQAHSALIKGDLATAQDLARQAVASNPANAQTWLTLGAAYQAAGNAGAARNAYQSCVAQAHSVGVSECRVLAHQ
jgi:tetratricopeptide (TPR) repeat protein